MADVIAARLGRWATQVAWSDVPAYVKERAALHVLDCVGLAFAGLQDDYAKVAQSALSASGPAAAIGLAERRPVADAALLNGILIHGLDYDDTHPPGVIHASASALPAAMAVAEERDLTGADLLLGYLIGVEISARIGTAANSGFHAKGFHPTGLVGAFGATAAAARLMGLDADTNAAAQGIVGSLASGSLQFLDTGAWTKRMHPGWAASSALSATRFAAAGWEAPPDIYEGRFGLFASHTPDGHEISLDAATAGLGEQWELLRVAIKPFPACHFTHAFADSAIIIMRDSGISKDDVAEIVCLVPQQIIPVVCEPADAKLTPRSDYDAKFSLPFVAAASALRGRFTLAELTPESLGDASILGLAGLVRYEVDPNSTFPKHFCGEVIVRTKDGRELRHRESVNRGADERPLSAEDIEAKFMDNVEIVATRAVAERVRDAVLGLADAPSAAAAIDVLRGQ
jgi:2-methylcitrate dehydratase PrpD